LSNLHHPEDKLPPTIHIAGTNGKGSTLAYLKTIFEDSGYRVHRYTSPHITRFNERIYLAGEEISDEYLYEMMEETRHAANNLQTTFFEGTTAGAFLAFSKTHADVFLMETGMGGRLDATNVLKNPIMTIITPISDDHCEYLGDTIAKIAYEKAGIIKPNSPCIIGWQMAEAKEVIINRCIEIGAPYYAHGIHWDFQVTDDGFNFIDLETDEAFSFPKPSLFGIHQTMNAACAVAAVRCLQQYDVGYQNIYNGLSNTKWMARMERIQKGVLHKLLPEGYELWVDGAHNTNGAQMISATITAHWQDKPTYLINGRTRDRDIISFLKCFQDKVKAVYGVKVESEPLGESAENIVTGAKSLGFEAHKADNITTAVKEIIKMSSQPCRILACGSLYLAGDILLANKAI
jgi:dihydrofolate synthase/folylpolyglutamate synthase